MSDLFTKRNLWALAAIRHFVDLSTNRDSFLFALTGTMLALSRMQRYSQTSGFPNMILLGTYYIPQVGREIEVLSWYSGKVNSLLKGLKKINFENPRLSISTSDIKSICVDVNTIDYIFTDPPYSSKVQYGELNYIWEAWLGFDTNWHDDEIIVNDVRGKTEADWASMMRLAMAECYRVLKPGRWISLCYHDTSEGTWALLQDIMAEVGFISEISDAALYIETGQKSFNQLMADKVNKRDLVINFRKPRPGEISGSVIITGDEDTITFAEKVRSIIRDYLAENPGSTKDRIYDELISKMVRSGQMEAHNFDAALRRVAEPVRDISESSAPDRWYMKESELSVVDQGETIKEDAAASHITSFIQKYLDENPGNEGVHYSDIFEFYIYAVNDKPRRSLADWLLDYFYKTDHGTYRLPATEDEEQVKKEGRIKGMTRRIKRYLSFLEQAIPISESERPDSSTLASWIHHCRRSGQYATGRTLYERGGIRLDRLSEDQQIELEEDYLVCIRNVTGTGSLNKLKPRQKKSLENKKQLLL